MPNNIIYSFIRLIGFNLFCEAQNIDLEKDRVSHEILLKNSHNFDCVTTFFHPTDLLYHKLSYIWLKF